MSSTPAKRSGRRRGTTQTREAIAVAGRAQFAELGYDRATFRGIAAAAGVDPALVVHFYGSKEELFREVMQLPPAVSDALASLADYTGRMAEGQEEIYYVLGSDLSSVRRSPHLEALEERGLETLLLADVMDGFMLQGLREFAGHKLRNIDEPNLNLPGEAKPSEVAVSDESFGRLVTRFKDVLGERVSAVRASSVLRSSPARLVSAEDAPNREMERIQRMLDRDYKTPARNVELNRSHALIADLAHMIDERPDDPLITPLIEQIYESALLLEGLHPNPASMVERIQKLMEAAAAPKS